MPTTDSQGRTISDDGRWWWDGSAWQPIKKNFFDTLADSVEGAVQKVEGSQGVTPPSMAQTPAPAPAAGVPAAGLPAAGVPPPEASVPSAAPAAGAPSQPAQVAAASPPAPTPVVIPPADLLAYLGALKHAGVVTDDEFESIRKRVPGQA